MGTKTTKKIRTAILDSLLLLSIIALSSLANAESLTFTGKVVLTDKESGAIAISPFDSSLNGAVFVLSNKVLVTIGRLPVSFGDIDAGDLVSVTYRKDSSGANIVESIAITSRPTEEQAYIILKSSFRNY